MKFSFTTVIFVILVLIFSVFVANISNLIAIEIESSFSGQYDPYLEKQENFESDSDLSETKETVTLNDEFDHLMWFVQISDIHVSIFHDSSRITEFQEFCERTISAVKPAVVLATGDLTDAKTADNVGSAQQVEEWQIYKNILIESHVVNVTVWLDIRGNHDNFNIPAPDSRLNYYRKYTVQGNKNPHSYLHTIDINGDKYGFLGLDACLSPGPKRPFNFVGMLNKTEAHHLKHLITETKDKSWDFVYNGPANPLDFVVSKEVDKFHLDIGFDVQFTVMFGHYPTSCIISDGQTSIRNLIAEVPGCWVYLCGHFHMLGGLVPNMYTLQKTGYLELELGDWKDNRIYRVAAFDHGFFTFIDTYHGIWPVILITNPKHALYNVPSKERLSVIVQSTHVRVLVFSLSSIGIVQVKIDDEDWVNASHVEGPLYVTKWNPSKYLSGMHTISVRARDVDGRVQGVTQPFSLDGTRLNFKFWPRLALMANISVMFQSLFGMALCVSIVPLCIFKVVHVLVKNSKLEKPNIKNRCLRRWIRSFWILATVDKVFYPLVIYPLYLSIGPWTVGEVIDGHVGAIFAWGLIVNNAYLPGSFTYAYGFLQMCTFQFPLTIVLAKAMDRRFQNVHSLEPQSKLKFLFRHLPILVVVSVQMVCAYFFWLAYGTLAFFIGPLRTWSIVLALVLWRICVTLPDTSLSDANLIWRQKATEDNEVGSTFNL